MQENIDMKKDYKSSLQRLAEYFELSRDKYKVRSAIYQKEKRELQIQIRDLERSKQKWKSECLQLRNEVAELSNKEKKTKELLLRLLNQ